MAAFLTLLAIAVALATPSLARLSPNYYELSCPQVERTVRESILHSLTFDRTAVAPLLRLAFHDCQVGACDASIMLDSRGPITSELVSDHNFGVRQLAFIDRAKAAVDAACGRGKVSCADILALAARDAVAITGGPEISIPLGRLDARFASNRAADYALPHATISITQLLELFGSKGMTPEETVAILGGGHTLGVAHCVNFVNRLYPRQDPTIAPAFASLLRAMCPVSNPRFMHNATSVPFDLTPFIFDNSYFRGVVNNQGLLTVDAELNTDPRTRPIVEWFAADQPAFFQVFASAFVKLTSSSVLTAPFGEVRNNCHFVN